MGDVAKLHPVRPEPDPDILRLAREILADAEAGKLLSLVVVGEMAMDDEMLIEHVASVGAGYYALLGALRMAEARILKFR